MAHMKPLPPETTPALADDFAIFERILGFVPNSLLTMQRQPAMVQGFGALTEAVMDRSRRERKKATSPSTSSTRPPSSQAPNRLSQ